MYQNPVGRHANLALVEERTPGGIAGCDVEVCVIQDDQGIAAAQLKGHFLQMAACQFTDATPHGGGAGESNHGHQRVGDQCFAGLRVTRQHLQQPCGQTGLGENAGNHEAAAHRRAGVRLDDHRIAGSQGGCHGADGQNHGEVER